MKQNKKFKFNKRKLMYGSASAIFIALFLVLVVVLNIFAQVFTDKFSLKFDLTQEKKYSISEQTKDVLSSLEEDVTIHILASETDMEVDTNAKTLLETIKKYSTLSKGKIDYAFIDVDRNPKFFKDHPEVVGSEVKSIVVESDKRYITVQYSDFTLSAQTTSGEASQTKTLLFYEEELTSAILYVTSEETAVAGFVSGHNEYSAPALKEIFGGNNIEYEEIDILQGGIAKNINNLVIVEPVSDFTAEEIDALDEYLKEPSNNLYVFWGMNSAVSELKNLQSYLAEWGVAFDTTMIFDLNNNYQAAYVIKSKLIENEIIPPNLCPNGEILCPNTTPINILWEANGNTVVEEIMTSYGGSYAKDLFTSIDTIDKAAGDATGPFTTGTVSYRMTSDSKPSCVAAFGSAYMLDDLAFTIERSENNAFLTYAIAALNPNTKTMQIAPKVDENHDLYIDGTEQKIILAVLVIAMPLIILAIGIFVFIRRKNR